MTVAEFYAFVRSQPREAGRFELIDGFVVRLMAGATWRHDRIVRNGLRLLEAALAGSRCQPFTADIFIRIPTPADRRRQADFGVECGAPDEDGMEADQPRAVFEVLSKSNVGGSDQFDFLAKIEDFRAVPSIEAIVLIDPYAPQALMHRRGPDGAWMEHPEPLIGPEAMLDLPMLGVRFSLADIYAGLKFRPRPMLVWPDDPEEPSAPPPGI
ncbi:Uma2 family endonuclease [Rhodopila globiformis]|uniref:Uma2 family endonuclease n=1 Tax=Rhodopila globiformis TaxID=1071 RepID=UPI001304E57F|nr:Uma2 family endonuclease [Rhodopila globiformis]